MFAGDLRQGPFYFLVFLGSDFVRGPNPRVFSEARSRFAEKCDAVRIQEQTVSPALLFVSLLLCLSPPLQLTNPWPLTL